MILANHRSRKRQGNSRRLGSTDQCERCGGAYTVVGGLQRFCPECQKAAHLEEDRREGLAYYRANKDNVNSTRNARRREVWKKMSEAQRKRLNAERKLRKQEERERKKKDTPPRA